MAKDSRKLAVGFLYDDTLDSNDGVTQYVKTLGAWLSTHGHTVSYLVGESQSASWAGGKVYSLSKNVKVRWGGNRLSIPALSSSAGIKAALAAQPLDVVHVQMPYSPLMAQRVINRLPADAAVVGTFHIMPGNQLATLGTKALKTVYGRSLSRIEQVVSVSQPAANFALETLKTDSVILPNVVNLSRYKSGERPAGPANHIVFLGRLVKRKGCEQLVRAFAQLLSSLPSARLSIAGDGPERASLERLVSELDIANKVVFQGYIDEKAKPSLLASADVACFPSIYGESFGIVLIEAMAAGAGVVLGGNNPGYASVLGQQAELLVDPNDTRAFSERLNKLLTDKKLARELHAWQLETVQQYDVKVVGPKLVDIYRTSIAKHQKAWHN